MATINGDGGNNTLSGTGGNDKINGKGGDDTLLGGGGNDRLNGGSGKDTYNGGQGDDRLIYDPDDFVGGDLAYFGGNGADRLVMNGHSADFSALDPNAALSIEVIHMEGKGASEVTLTSANVASFVNDLNAFTYDGPLYVTGDESDKLFIADFTKTGIVQQGDDGRSYHFYTDGDNYVAVDADVQVNPPVAVDDTDDATEAGGKNNGTAGEDPTGNVLDNDMNVTGVSAVQEGPEGGPNTAGTVDGETVGTYGSLFLNSDGSYQYKVDNDNATVEALNVGDDLTDTFTYTATNGSDTDDGQLTITINGANDDPVANNDNNKGGTLDEVTEAGGQNNNVAGDDTAMGNVLNNDTDVDDTMLEVSKVDGSSADVGMSVTGTYGSIVINDDGTYTYTLDDDAPATEALKDGEQVFDEFNYQDKDPQGETDNGRLRIFINGANDAPTAETDRWIVSDGANVTAPNQWFLHNDTDPENDPLDVTAAAPGGGTSLVDSVTDMTNTVVVQFKDTGLGSGDSTADTDAIDYTLSDGDLLTQGDVDVTAYGTSGGDDTVNISGETYDFSYLKFGQGADMFTGGDGDDIVFGNRGADTLFGGAGDDELHGGRGADTINGNQGTDIIFGGRGADLIHGGKDDDNISGERGADMIYGDKGDDTIDPGDGKDTIFYNDGGTDPEAQNGFDTIVNFDAGGNLSGSVDLFDIDELLDGLNYLENSERNLEDGFLIVDNGNDNYDIRIDLTPDTEFGQTDPNDFGYLMANVTVVAGTFLDETDFVLT